MSFVYFLFSAFFIGLFGLSFSKKRHPYLLYFGLFLAAMAVNLLVVLNHQDSTLLKYLSYGASTFFMLFYKEIFGKKFSWLWQVHLICWAMIVLFSSINAVPLEAAYLPYSMINIGTVLYIAVCTILMAYKGNQDAKIFTLGLIALVITLLIDISLAVKVSNYAPTQTTTWGLLIFTIILSAILLKRFKQQGSNFIYEAFTFARDLNELKMKADSMVMHTIKNELHRLMYLNERNHRFIEDPKQLGHNFISIDESLQHMDQMVQAFSRTEHVDLNLKHIPVNQIILDAIKSFQTKVAIEAKLPLTIVAEVDSLHFKECIINLLSNSLEAIDHSNGKIRISLFQKHREAILEISDNGKGIPHENVKEVISPLFTTKKSGSHFGLGLYYVYCVVKKHGGSLTIPYSEPGKGTTIQIRLPLKSKRRWNYFGKNKSYAG